MNSIVNIYSGLFVFLLSLYSPSWGYAQNFVHEDDAFSGTAMLYQGRLYKNLSRLNDLANEKTIKLVLTKIGERSSLASQAAFYYLGLTYLGQNRFGEAKEAFGLAVKECEEGTDETCFSPIFSAARHIQKMIGLVGKEDRVASSAVITPMDYLAVIKNVNIKSGNDLTILVNPVVEALSNSGKDPRLTVTSIKKINQGNWGAWEYRIPMKDGGFFYFYNPLNIHFLSSFFLDFSISLFQNDVTNGNSAVEPALAMSLIERGRYAEAASILERKSIDFKNNPRASLELKVLLFQCYSHLGKEKESDELAKELSSIAMSEETVHISMKYAVSLARDNGKFESAKTIMQKNKPLNLKLPSSSGFPNRAMFRFHSYLRALGEVYMYSGDYQTASLYFQRAFLASASRLPNDRDINPPLFKILLASAWFHTGNINSALENIFNGSALSYYCPESIQTGKILRIYNGLQN